MNWKERGLNIRFADDIVLLTESPAELPEILKELNEKSKEAGRKINFKKTNVMFNSLAT